MDSLEVGSVFSAHLVSVLTPRSLSQVRVFSSIASEIDTGWMWSSGFFCETFGSFRLSVNSLQPTNAPVEKSFFHNVSTAIALPPFPSPISHFGL